MAKRKPKQIAIPKLQADFNPNASGTQVVTSPTDPHQLMIHLTNSKPDVNEFDVFIEALKQERQFKLNIANFWNTAGYAGEVSIDYNQVISNPVNDWITSTPWGIMDKGFGSCYEAYDHIIGRSDGHIISEYNAAKQMLMSLEWHLEDGGEEEYDKQITKRIQQWLEIIDDGSNNGLDGLFSLCWRGIMFGMQPIKLHWETWNRKKNDREWIIPKVATGFPPELVHYVFNDDGVAKLYVKSFDTSSVIGTPVNPISLIVQHADDTAPPIRPYGQGVLAPLYMISHLKNYAMYQAVSYMEQFGKPLIMILYKDGYEAEAKKIKNSLGGGIRGMIAYPKDPETGASMTDKPIDVSFSDTQRSATDVFGEFIKLLDLYASKLLIGAPLTTGQGQYGTQALGTVHQQTSDIITAARAKQAEKVINRIIQLIGHFDFPTRPLPKFRFNIRLNEHEGQPYLGMLDWLYNKGLPIAENTCYNAVGEPKPPAGARVVVQGNGIGTIGAIGGGTIGGGEPTAPPAPTGGMGGGEVTPIAANPAPALATQGAPATVTEMGGLPPAAKTDLLLENLNKQLTSEKSTLDLESKIKLQASKGVNDLLGRNYKDTYEKLQGQRTSFNGKLVTDFVENALIAGFAQYLDVNKDKVSLFRVIHRWNNGEAIINDLRAQASAIALDELEDWTEIVNRNYLVAQKERWDHTEFTEQVKGEFTNLSLTDLQADALRLGYNMALYYSVMANPDKYFGFRWKAHDDEHSSADGHIGSLQAFKEYQGTGKKILPIHMPGCKCELIPITIVEADFEGWVRQKQNLSYVVFSHEPNGKLHIK